MYLQRLDELVAAWEQAFHQYASRKTEAEQAVTRWEWTSGERYSPLPYHFQRSPGRGRVLKHAPAPGESAEQAGLDDLGRARVIRSLPRGAQLYSERFIRFTASQIETVEYSAAAPRIPLCIQRIDLENGRVMRCDTFRLNGFTPRYAEKGRDPRALYDWLGYNGRMRSSEDYLYEGARLAAVEGYYEYPGIPPYTAQEQFEYDHAGALRGIRRVYADGQAQVVYRRRDKGMPFRALREQVTQKLVAAVIERIRQARISETLYCLTLNYRLVAQHFPPCLVAAPESYRRSILRSGDPAARRAVYIPILGREWFYTIEDPETLEICQVMEQEIQAGQKWHTATRILRYAAAALTRADWSGIAPVTPDFVVFALDPEMESDQMEQVLSASASQQQIRQWKRFGWI